MSESTTRHRRIILASGSPTRLKVLTDAGIDVVAIESGVSEDFGPVATQDAVLALARRKAMAVAAFSEDELVLGCDSLLDLDGETIGKPGTAEKAREIWKRLRGRCAILHTGHCLIDTSKDQGNGGINRVVSRVDSTLVRFSSPSGEEIDAYIASGEPLSLAGACSIEGLGAPFVEGIDGSSTNVLGVSLPLLRTMLAELGVSITDLWRQDRDSPGSVER